MEELSLAFLLGTILKLDTNWFYRTISIKPPNPQSKFVASFPLDLYYRETVQTLVSSLEGREGPKMR